MPSSSCIVVLRAVVCRTVYNTAFPIRRFFTLILAFTKICRPYSFNNRFSPALCFSSAFFRIIVRCSIFCPTILTSTSNFPPSCCCYRNSTPPLFLPANFPQHCSPHQQVSPLLFSLVIFPHHCSSPQQISVSQALLSSLTIYPRHFFPISDFPQHGKSY